MRELLLADGVAEIEVISDPHRYDTRQNLTNAWVCSSKTAASNRLW